MELLNKENEKKVVEILEYPSDYTIDNKFLETLKESLRRISIELKENNNNNTSFDKSSLNVFTLLE